MNNHNQHEMKQQDEEEEDSRGIIFRYERVYNEEEETRTVPMTNYVSKSSENKPVAGPAALKCTVWRCRKCNQEFPTPNAIIQHVKQNTCLNSSIDNTVAGQHTQCCPSKNSQGSEAKRQTEFPKATVRYRSRLSNETEEQRQLRLGYAKRRRCQNETEEQRKLRLQRRLSVARRRLQIETEEERQVRLTKAKERFRLRLQRETEDQRKSRLQKALESTRKRLLNETEEEYETRLAKVRLRRLRNKKVREK